MPSVSDSFECVGPAEAVFDLVTTARFWPQWHPATRGVEGDVDRPAQLGDRITEHVVIAGIEGTGAWTVVARDRPHRLVLEADLSMGRFQISYTFTHTSRTDGGWTRMRRDLVFPDLGPAVAGAMRVQSAEGVQRLGRLVAEHLTSATRVPPGAGGG
jgi:uncharacterized protein YndB with AHSA1/START domain